MATKIKPQHCNDCSHVLFMYENEGVELECSHPNGPGWVDSGVGKYEGDPVGAPDWCPLPGASITNYFDEFTKNNGEEE